MTFSELEAILIDNNIPKALYRINETPSDNTYCILYDGDQTEVFYFERGIRFDCQSFGNKEKGIQYFLKLLVK